MMRKRILKFRWLGAIVLALTLIALATACGSDPTPTPTPEPTATPTPMPTPTPEPTATPEPPTPAPDSQMASSLEDLVITPATTGKDLIDALSEEEAACIKTAFGDAIYQIMLATPLLMAGADPGAAAPLFGCLATENIVRLGVSFLGAQAGGWSEESRQCITEAGLRHPDAIYVRLGLDSGEEPIDASETLAYNVEIYDCLNNEEKKTFTLAFWVGVDSQVDATGNDILGVLSESEAACVREGLSEEQFTAMIAAQPLEAVSIGSSVSGCIEPETNIKIFTSGIQWALGEATEETVSCLEDFARKTPVFVALFASGLKGMEAMPADRFVEITDLGTGQYACMTEEELLRVQLGATAAMQQQ